MKIDSSILQFAASASSQEREERMRTARMQQSPAPMGRVTQLSSYYDRRENVRLESSQSSSLYSRSQIQCADKPQAVQISSRESMVQSVVSHAFSREISISQTVALRSSASRLNHTANGANIASQASVTFGQAYRYQSQQRSTLTIEGRLELADRRSIDFVLHTQLDSSLLFESGSGEFARFALRTDPLILNLQGGSAQLTDTAFQFDIDGDGTKESISFATGGSGFIAFDRNGDNIINDGRELFGAQSGNGFADLARYDDDGNGFIDSADAIFAQLKFWSRSEDGNDQLISLEQAGVAAIGLENTSTPMQLRGNAAQELGVLRSTGIFVMEDGTVGTVQQVDLAQRNIADEQALLDDFDNAQFVPQELASAPANPEQQKLQDVMDRLDALHAEYLDRLDAVGDPESKENKSLLAQLADSLEQQIKELAQERKESCQKPSHSPKEN